MLIQLGTFWVISMPSLQILDTTVLHAHFSSSNSEHKITCGEYQNSWSLVFFRHGVRLFIFLPMLWASDMPWLLKSVGELPLTSPTYTINNVTLQHFSYSCSCIGRGTTGKSLPVPVNYSTVTLLRCRLCNFLSHHVSEFSDRHSLTCETTSSMFGPLEHLPIVAPP